MHLFLKLKKAGHPRRGGVPSSGPNGDSLLQCNKVHGLEPGIPPFPSVLHFLNFGHPTNLVRDVDYRIHLIFIVLIIFLFNENFIIRCKLQNLYIFIKFS